MNREQVQQGLRRLALPALFLWGVGICLYCGRIGFQPLDQSIAYDGAYRVSTGQVPFRHFDLPAGLVPILMQAAVYSTLGRSWFWYCLHAAVVNGLFALAAFGLLRRMGAGRAVAVAYAALAGLTFYPPIGVPYHDLHSFFFSFLGLLAMVAAGQARSPRRAFWLGLAVPWAMVAAVLSKPIPAAFVLPLLPLGLAVAGWTRRRPVAAGLCLGTVSVLALLAAAAWAASIAPERLLRDFVTLPAGTVGPRWDWLRAHRPVRLVGWFWEILRRTHLAPVVAVAMAAGTLLVGIAGTALLRGQGGPEARRRHARDLGAGLLALGLLLASGLFALLTQRSPASAVGYVFVSVGLLHATAAGRLLGGASAGADGLRPRRRLAARLLAVGLVAACAVGVVRFHDRVNLRRESNLVLPLPRGVVAERVESPADLRFLLWALPDCCSYRWQDFAALVEHFERQPGNFLLLGDSSILYALSGRPSINPALWFHPGLTFPSPLQDRRGFHAYQRRLVRRMRLFAARWLVIEGERTMVHKLTLEDFPHLARYVAGRECGREAFGAFTVIRLCRPPGRRGS